VWLTSNQPLGPVVATTGEWLHRWATESPDRVFLAERSGAGWRKERYGAVLEQVRAIAGALLGRGMTAKTPILILSGNGVDHGLLTLAAQYIGVPTVPVAEQYSLISSAHGRLQQVVELVCPAMVYVVDADEFADALALGALQGVEVVASRAGSAQVTDFADLLKGDGVDLAAAHAAVTPDTVAKILMTSGSTSAPKGVLTTHKMMCTNQTQIADSLPFLRARPPRIVDWLPWNHVFGGSHNFNMMLANGGSFYIDDGKPVKGLFERTVENLSLTTGTLCFNVPVGFQMLLAALRADTALRQRFFAELDLIFYAGASLPQDVWDGFEAMAMEVKGEVPLMTSSWGLTETAPAAMIQQEPTERSGVVGIPVSGIVAKLLPDVDGRFEVRVKGPSIMEGYFQAPDKTAQAFDAEGFFITGDAMRFVDPSDINKGLRFDGRISDDFKLLTGTWVRAAQLRIDLLVCLAPLAGDLVVTGADRGEIGALIFAHKADLEACGYAPVEDHGALVDAALLADIAMRLAAHAQGASSSTRVMRALVLSEPASMAEAEITAKGNLNFRKVLTRRAALLARLYDDADPAVAKL
jgi:feruloyl-CoA synthase